MYKFNFSTYVIFQLCYAILISIKFIIQVFFDVSLPLFDRAATNEDK